MRPDDLFHGFFDFFLVARLRWENWCIRDVCKSKKRSTLPQLGCQSGANMVQKSLPKSFIFGILFRHRLEPHFLGFLVDFGCQHGSMLPPKMERNPWST